MFFSETAAQVANLNDTVARALADQKSGSGSGCRGDVFPISEDHVLAQISATIAIAKAAAVIAYALAPDDPAAQAAHDYAEEAAKRYKGGMDYWDLIRAKDWSPEYAFMAAEGAKSAAARCVAGSADAAHWAKTAAELYECAKARK